MPLIRYSQYITYPDGNPAANVLAPVWLVGGNTLIPAFSDKAGTTPVANPVMTDLDGLLTFFAAPGAFCSELAGQMFHLMVDATETDSAWPGTFIHDQAVPSAVWTVEHHFGVQPTAEILIGGARVEATITHPDDETTTLTFSSPQAGTAYLRR